MRLFNLALLSSFFLVPIPAYSFEKLEGYFIAEAKCDAYQSKNKRTNPGDIQTRPSTAYSLKGINKQGGDFFQIVVPNSPVTEARWVSVECGIHAIKAETLVAEHDTPDLTIERLEGEEAKDLLLALSWQPAFCEKRPGKTECTQLNSGFLPYTEQQLSIHGLWPQPRGNVYCGVPSAIKALDKPATWHKLPDLDLDAETREALDVAMPGSASSLDKHEWIKHGTCYFAKGGADEYYDDTLLVTDAINKSEVGEFLAAHVGATVETMQIRAQFDLAFGQGAGDRVQFHCSGDGNRVLIQELKINLFGPIEETSNISDLILAADETSIGCERGVIDPTGLQ